MKQKIMNPENPDWPAFCVGMREMKSCDHSLDFTIETLNAFPGLDIEGSLDFFREHGGHCDCEVVMNVISRHES